MSRFSEPSAIPARALTKALVRVRVAEATEAAMIRRPSGISAFEFAVLSGLRAAQLNRGCTPRVERSAKIAITAQQEIAERKVLRGPDVGKTA